MTDAKQTSPCRRRSWAEPYKIKVVEPLKITTCTERHTFLLRSQDVYID
ncbi:hypothetical protein [Nostoc sp. FACHB-892]|nr:hypothetical protein [Nostoc sp. FACHB-892]